MGEKRFQKIVGWATILGLLIVAVIYFTGVQYFPELFKSKDKQQEEKVSKDTGVNNYQPDSNNIFNKPATKILVQENRQSGTKPKSVSIDPDKSIKYPNDINDARRFVEGESNNYINNTAHKNDIALLIIDNNNRPVNSLSSEIANLYRSKGHSVTTSLFTTSFLNSSYLNEVQAANSRTMDKLELPSFVNYVVIGKYNNDSDPGEYTKWISRATLDVTVISCISKSQQDAFTIPVASAFDDKQHAENGAKEKIVQSYKVNHLNL